MSNQPNATRQKKQLHQFTKNCSQTEILSKLHRIYLMGFPKGMDGEWPKDRLNIIVHTIANNKELQISMIIFIYENLPFLRHNREMWITLGIPQLWKYMSWICSNWNFKLKPKGPFSSWSSNTTDKNPIISWLSGLQREREREAISDNVRACRFNHYWLHPSTSHHHGKKIIIWIGCEESCDESGMDGK